MDIRTAITNALSVEYHFLYGPDNDKLSVRHHEVHGKDRYRQLGTNETLASLKAFDPDQTFVLQWAEHAADTLGIDRSRLRETYGTKERQLKEGKMDLTVGDLVEILQLSA